MSLCLQTVLPQGLTQANVLSLAQDCTLKANMMSCWWPTARSRFLPSIFFRWAGRPAHQRTDHVPVGIEDGLLTQCTYPGCLQAARTPPPRHGLPRLVSSPLTWKEFIQVAQTPALPCGMTIPRVLEGTQLSGSRNSCLTVSTQVSWFLMSE